MVDNWPTTLSSHTLFRSNAATEDCGVAALAPQFDQAINTNKTRRSLPPIGSLTPETHTFPPPTPLTPSLSLASSLPKSYYPFPAPSRNPHASPPVPAADFLAECSSHASASTPSLPAHNLPSSHPFDLFGGLATLDLGPPIIPTHSPEPSPPCPHPTPHHVSPIPYSYTAHDLSLSVSPPRRHAPPPYTTSPPPTHRPHKPFVAQPPQPAASPPARARELPHPTRCVLVRNIPPGVDDDDLRSLLHAFGPLRDLGAQQRSRGGRGSVLATYFDLRHAREAVRQLEGQMHFGRKFDVRFQCPVDSHAVANPAPPGAPAAACPSANQGTLVVFNLDVSTSAEDIRALFSQVGDVKEIRATPNKKHHKFVEFYDVRDAEKALLKLNKSEVAGKRIKIEISRPGGRANGISRTPTQSKPVPIAASSHWKSAAARGHSFDGVAAMPSATRLGHSGPGPNGGSNGPLHFGSEDRSASCSSSAVGRATADCGSVQVTCDDDAFASRAFNVLSTSFPPLSSASNPDREEAPAALPVPGKEVNGVLGFGHGVADGLAGSLDRSLKSLHGVDDEMELASVFKMFGIAGMEDAENAQSAPVKHHSHDSYMQALYHSASSDDGRGIGSSATDESPGRTVACGEDGALNGMHDDDSGMKMHGIGGKGGANGKVGGMNGMLANLGGGVAGCCPATHSKYSLDLRRVRSGEETRTALMIRNIPNKYNQKMLVSTLEDGHKGHFDFIYLPIDFKNKCNVGYAFINLTKAEFIEGFYEAFHGKKWGRFNSEKVCEITFARIQGRQQLIAHFQNSSLLLEDPKCRPVIFDSMGRQEEFPIGSHVRTRRGPSSRDCGQRVGDSAPTSPPYSPSKHRGRA